MTKKKRPRGTKPRKTRPRSNEELTRDLVRAVRLLHDAVERFDNGDDSALELMAPRLRLLLCHGRGNELLFRVCKRLGVRIPSIQVDSPVPSDQSLSFALGALPVDEEFPKVRRIPLDALMKDMCLATADSEGLVYFSWDELLSDAANKILLVHSDDEIPAIFDEIVTYEVAGKNVIAFMLRILAVAAMNGIFESLSSIVSFERDKKGLDINGLRVAGIQVRGRL